MKIILYTSENIINEIQENVSSPEVDEDSVFWEGGGMQGIKLNFAIVGDEAEVSIGDIFDPALDRKTQFLKKDNIQILENQQVEQDLAISAIFEMMIGGV
jgi:hypothetical protein